MAETDMDYSRVQKSMYDRSSVSPQPLNLAYFYLTISCIYMKLTPIHQLYNSKSAWQVVSSVVGLASLTRASSDLVYSSIARRQDEALRP
jgi:hypothetical protein